MCDLGLGLESSSLSQSHTELHGFHPHLVRPLSEAFRTSPYRSVLTLLFYSLLLSVCICLSLALERKPGLALSCSLLRGEARELSSSAAAAVALSCHCCSCICPALRLLESRTVSYFSLSPVLSNQ